MKRTSLAYCAGIFDSEGSITMQKNGYASGTRRPVLTVSMTSPEPIEFLYETLGGFKPKRPAPKPGWKQQYAWQTNGSKAIETLRLLEPYLHIDRRKNIANLLIEKYPIASPGGNSKTLNDLRSKRSALLFKEGKRLNAIRKTEIPTLTPTPNRREDWAYLAGCLDGEGYIRKLESSPGHMAEIWSTDPELVGWLHAQFGGKTYSTKQLPRPRRKDSYSWRIGKADARAIFPRVRPFILLPQKQERINAFLKTKPYVRKK